MKKFLLLGTLLVGLAMNAGTAQANTYATAFIGGTAVSDADNNGNGWSIDSEYDNGFVVGGVVGYNVRPGLALEGEIAYRRNGADSISEPTIGKLSASGHVSALSAMVNGRINVGTLHNGSGNDNAGLYILGGVGVAQLNADIDASSIRLVDDSDVVFAYQVGVGYGIPVNDQTNIEIGYRFFGTADPELKDDLGEKFDSEYQSHAVMIGLTKKF